MSGARNYRSAHPVLLLWIIQLIGEVTGAIAFEPPPHSCVHGSQGMFRGAKGCRSRYKLVYEFRIARVSTRSSALAKLCLSLGP